MKAPFFAIIMLSVLILACDGKKSKIPQAKSKEPVQTTAIENNFEPEGEVLLLNEGIELKKLQVAFAITAYETQDGLMNHSQIAENQGMLFIFEEEEPKQFWMKNTRIPLDIIYVNADSIVTNIAKNAQPMQEQGVEASAGKVKFVLEVNAGMSDKWGIIPNKTKLSWHK